MSFELHVNVRNTVLVSYLKVSAGVRYWEDATVNGVEDTDGHLIPLRVGDNWEPIIDLRTGKIQGWPEGTAADVHYKVCDEGEYLLLDAQQQPVGKHRSAYVPDDLLCPTGNGYGDYIIMKIGPDGQIDGWPSSPPINSDEWEAA